MSKQTNKYCQVCLTTNEEDNIKDSTCFIKIFIQITAKEKFLDKLWLCMWCRATMKNTVELTRLALQSEQVFNSKKQFQDVIQGNLRNKLSYCSPTISYIAIPPSYSIEEQEVMCKEEIHESNKIELNCNEDNVEFNKTELFNFVKNTFEIDNEKQSVENEFEFRIQEKRKQNTSRMEDLKFEVKYLNLEEQLEQIEIKKNKFKNKYGFVCDLCGAGFVTQESYEEHGVKHTEKYGQYKCKICHLNFKSKSVHAHHILIHRRHFVCKICGVKISKRYACDVHRQRCGSIQEYVKCALCHKIFSDVYSLKIHEKHHNLEEKYSCTKCDAKFKTKNKLSVHFRSHTGVKPFRCKECSRSFSTSSNLNAHYKTHTDIHNYYCVECNNYYKSEKSYKRHINNTVKHANVTSMFRVSV